MQRVALRKLVLNDFRSFKGRHEIEFPESGLVFVKGLSGVGKTNLLRAIAYAFDVCPIAQKNLVCWDATGPMSVEVHMDTDAGPAVLTRGTKGCSLQLPGETVQGDAKAVKERVNRLCGVGPDLREILTYRDQRKPKKFLSMGAAEKREFLTAVLGLQKFEKQVTEQVKVVSAAAQDLNTASNLAWNGGEELDAAERALAEAAEHPLEDEIVLAVSWAKSREAQQEAEACVKRWKEALQEALVQQEAEIAEAVASSTAELEGLREELAAAKARASVPVDQDRSELERLRSLLKKCERHLDATSKKDAEARAAYDAETQRMRGDAERLREKMMAGNRAGVESQKLRKELLRLQSDQCSMCGRAWDEAAAKAREVAAQLDELEKVKLAGAEAALAGAVLLGKIEERAWIEDPNVEKLRRLHADFKAKIAAELQRLQGEVQNRTAAALAEVAEVQIRVDFAAERVRAARAAVLAAPGNQVASAKSGLQEATERLSRAADDVARAQGNLNVVRERNARHRAIREQCEARVDRARRQKATTDQEVATATKKHNEEADYLDVIRGFRNRIFDETLASIGTEATDILQGLPNAQHITVEFRSQRETEDGNLRDEIRAYAYLNGQERPLEDTVSGGQITSVELAIDLAVARVVSRRHGCALQWLILDETFNGHDRLVKAACLDVLRQYAQDRLIIIVDHHSEFQDLFAQTLTVTQENGRSRVEVSR